MATERIVRARASTLPLNADPATAAPAQYLLSGTESLYCYVTGGGTGIEILIAVRILRPTGAVTSNTFRFVATSINTIAPVFFPLGEGALLGIQIQAGDSTSLVPDWATCYVRAGLALGDSGAHRVIATLVQSYITTLLPAVWPGTPFRAPFEGPGRWAVRDFGNGQIGQGMQVQGQLGERFRMSLLAFRFTTSAAGVNRQVVVQLDSLATLVHIAWSLVGHVPAAARDYYAVFGGLDRDSSGLGVVQISLPPAYFLQQQDNIFVDAANRDAGDQFTAVRIYGERWVEP